MSSNSGSSGGGSSSSGGSSKQKYNPDTGRFDDVTTEQIAPQIADRSVAPMPVAQSAAPRGAFLGTTGGGNSMTSNGDGTASDGNRSVTLPTPSQSESSSSVTKYVPTSMVSKSAAAIGQTAQSLNAGGGGGGDNRGDVSTPIGTTVNQPTAPGGGPLDSSTERRKAGAAYRSNNFSSMISRASALSKRTLIGGA